MRLLIDLESVIAIYRHSDHQRLAELVSLFERGMDLFSNNEEQ